MTIKIGIKADIGLFTLRIEWKFQKSLFKFKGIEKKDIVLRLPTPNDPPEKIVFQTTQVRNR